MSSRKLSLSASLGCGEEAQKRHARNSDGDAAIIKVLSYPLCFRSLRLVAVALGRSSWWQNWACDRHDFILGATAGVRYTMICNRERGCCPDHHSLRFTTYRLGGNRRSCPHSYGSSRGCCPRKNMPCKLEGILQFKSNSSSEGVYLPGYYPYPELLWVLCNTHTRTKNSCEFCTTYIPVPGTSVRSVRPCHNTWGTGTAFYTCPELL